jgi:metal-responsive CopG/Arc/MetJ family transcriptional regulator
MIMTTLSVILPDNLARASREAAQKLGMSRTQFIRQALIHEIENIQSKLEEEAIIKSIIAMKTSEGYLKESEEITQGLNSKLPKDKDEWWKKE